MYRCRFWQEGHPASGSGRLIAHHEHDIEHRARRRWYIPEDATLIDNPLSAAPVHSGNCRRAVNSAGHARGAADSLPGGYGDARLTVQALLARGVSPPSWKPCRRRMKAASAAILVGAGPVWHSRGGQRTGSGGTRRCRSSCRCARAWCRCFIQPLGESDQSRTRIRPAWSSGLFRTRAPTRVFCRFSGARTACHAAAGDDDIWGFAMRQHEDPRGRPICGGLSCSSRRMPLWVSGACPFFRWCVVWKSQTAERWLLEECITPCQR